MRRIICIMLIIACACSCNRFDIDEVLLPREDLSMTLNGKVQFSFDDNTCQIGYNDARNEFRLHDDSVGNWVKLTCRARPSSVGQTVKADLSWTSSTSNKSRKGLTFTVEKIEQDGRIWLWCQSDNIGLVVKVI